MDTHRLAARLAVMAVEQPTVPVMFRPTGEPVSAAMLQEIALNVRDALTATAPSAPSRVALEARNTVEAVGALHGIWQAGASAVLVSPMVPDVEAQRRRAATGCRAMVTWVDDGTVEVTSLAVDSGMAQHDGEAAIVFTSGTTGQAKAASIPFRALESAVDTVLAGTGFREGDRPLVEPARAPQIVFVSLAHMGGLLATQTSWVLGKPLLFVPRFDVELAFDLVHRFAVTTLALTPAMVYDMAYALGDRDLGAVKSVGCGTAALPEATRLAFEGRFGVPVLRNYGQTEFSGAIAFERYADVVAGRRPPMSVGRIADGVTVRIVDEDGHDLPHGEIGEIWASGGSAMAGYLDDDGRPSSGTRDGWVATGDLGTVDPDGFLSVVGRRREVLICGGFNVYPAVVEAAVNDLPGVLDCAVAGVPDERLGDLPVVAVVARPGTQVELVPMREVLRTRLSAYELPRDLRVVEAIPRTANGKVDRPAVAALFGDRG